MNKQIMAETKCYKCKYQAITWYENKNNLNNCLKCGSKLEVLTIEK